MLKIINRQSLKVSAGLFTGLMSSPAFAAGDTNFSTVTTNMGLSLEKMPGLLSSVSYLFGLLLGTLGILKIKDHVENPGQTHLKDGAIRLAAGGALFALPMITDAMLGTIGDQENAVGMAKLNKVDVNAGLK